MKLHTYRTCNYCLIVVTSIYLGIIILDSASCLQIFYSLLIFHFISACFFCIVYILMLPSITMDHNISFFFSFHADPNLYIYIYVFLYLMYFYIESYCSRFWSCILFLNVKSCGGNGGCVC